MKLFIMLTIPEKNNSLNEKTNLYNIYYCKTYEYTAILPTNTLK